MPYDQDAIRATIEEADLSLRMVPRDQLEAARALLECVRALLDATSFEAGPVSDIVATSTHELIEMSVSHPDGRKVIEGAAGYLMVQFRHDHDHVDSTHWILQWWWDGGEHADHTSPTQLSLTYIPRTREFRGPDGSDAGVHIVRGIARKMMGERTRVAEAPAR